MSAEFFVEHLRHGWDYKFVLITNYLSALTVPKEGAILQMGASLGCSLEKLCQLYGHDRCVGWDIDNPLNHPNIKYKDCNVLTDSDNMPLSLTHVDTGSVMRASDGLLRKRSLLYAIKNTVLNGHIFTIGYSNWVEHQLGFSVSGLLCDFGFECLPTVEVLNIPGHIVDEYKSKGIDLTMELVATKKSL